MKENINILKRYAEILTKTSKEVCNIGQDYIEDVDSLIYFRDTSIKDLFSKFLYQYRSSEYGYAFEETKRLLSTDENKIYDIIFNEDISKMPLYLNHEDIFIKSAAIFRLSETI